MDMKLSSFVRIADTKLILLKSMGVVVNSAAKHKNSAYSKSKVIWGFIAIFYKHYHRHHHITNSHENRVVFF